MEGAGDDYGAAYFSGTSYEAYPNREFRRGQPNLRGSEANRELPTYSNHADHRQLVTDEEAARAGILPPQLRMIADVFLKCSTGCQRVQAAVEEPVPLLAPVKGEILELIQTLLAWGSQHRATWPSRFRDSLDDRMVFNRSMHERVEATLDQMQNSLHDIADRVRPGQSPPGYDAVEESTSVEEPLRNLHEGMKRLLEAAKSFRRFHGCLGEYAPDSDPDRLEALTIDMKRRVRAMMGKRTGRGSNVRSSNPTWPRLWFLAHPEAQEFAELLIRANAVRTEIFKYWRNRPYGDQFDHPLRDPSPALRSGLDPSERGHPDHLPDRFEHIKWFYRREEEHPDQTYCANCGQFLDHTDRTPEDPACHLWLDLRAYLCTYPGCKDRDIMYGTKAEWIAHERSAHRWHYACPRFGCDFRAWEESELRQHLTKAQFSKRIPDDLSQFRAPEPWKRDCLLCGKEGVYFEQMEEHYAVHLEDIALVALHHNERLKRVPSWLPRSFPPAHDYLWRNPRRRVEGLPEFEPYV